MLKKKWFNIFKRNTDIKYDRIEQLCVKYSSDEELFELLTLLEEVNNESKMYSEENLVDLGERRAYNKIKMEIFKKY